MIRKLSLLVLLAAVLSAHSHPACTHSAPFSVQNMFFHLRARAFRVRCTGIGDSQSLVVSAGMFFCLIWLVKILPFTSIHLLFRFEEGVLFNFLTPGTIICFKQHWAWFCLCIGSISCWYKIRVTLQRLCLEMESLKNEGENVWRS